MTYSTYFRGSPAEVVANALACLIHHTNFLLDRQRRQLGQRFLAEGGFTERLYRARRAIRGDRRRET
jgi:restriction system protein